MKDHYTTLGVSSTSTVHDIKRAYRKLAVKYHPDKNPDPQAEALFKEINEAYDVLSDPEKKMLYDQRLQNSFAEILHEQQPKHRDPRYRPKPPGQRPVSQKADVHDLMREYLPYIRWISYVGLLVTILLAVDYVLPYRTVEEDIKEIYVVRGRRNAILYNVLITEKNRKIRIYNLEAGYFRDETSVRISKTLLFSTVMAVSDSSGTHSVRLAYLYRALILFPLILFITSTLGIVFRNKVEFPFNLNIVSAILLIITLALIF